jgi:hypothetical protein
VASTTSRGQAATASINQSSVRWSNALIEGRAATLWLAAAAQTWSR